MEDHGEHQAPVLTRLRLVLLQKIILHPWRLAGFKLQARDCCSSLMPRKKSVSSRGGSSSDHSMRRERPRHVVGGGYLRERRAAGEQKQVIVAHAESPWSRLAAEIRQRISARRCEKGRGGSARWDVSASDGPWRCMRVADMVNSKIRSFWNKWRAYKLEWVAAGDLAHDVVCAKSFLSSSAQNLLRAPPAIAAATAAPAAGSGSAPPPAPPRLLMMVTVDGVLG